MNHNPNSNLPLDVVLEQLRVQCQQPFEQANPIPAAVNHSLEFLEHERKRIFTQEWICLGREDEIAGNGDYLTQEIASVPVLVIRSKGKVKAFVNACAHRFACLIPEEKGSARKFTCRYHGWTYNCDGQLVAAPHMKMKSGFNVADHCLRPLQITVWHGFIYVSLAERPGTDLHSALQPLADNVIGRYDIASYQTVLREKMTWKANWKNLVENFTESYHVPIAHGQTFARHQKALNDYIVGEDSDHYCYHRAAQELDQGLGAAHPDNQRLQGEWRRMMVDFCVFPCHLVTLLPDYVWYISVQPCGVDQMQAMWGVAVPPEVLEDVSRDRYDQWLEEFKAFIDVANGEDKTLVEALHLGSKSPLLPQGTYHPIERNLWQFARYLNRACSN
jgi:phenylpropionate dioxygenase-like ring-hydroxylating dioxygenase large terminal subunit